MKSLLTFIRSRNIVPVLVIFYAVGVVGMIVPSTREMFKQLTPFTLLMTTILLFIYHENYSNRFWFTALGIFFAGFFLEVAGVKSGLLFGDYTYGATLGLKVFDTPLMIGVNWLMLVYCSNMIAGKFIDSLYFRSIVAASAMVVYDFALEPSAIYFDMWSWAGGPVPLQNYIAWFVIAFILNLIAGRFELVNRNNKFAVPLFFVQIMFFILLDIWIFVEKLWV
jgi:putative membrane protein